MKLLFLLLFLVGIGPSLEETIFQAELSTKREIQKKFAAKALAIAQDCIQKGPPQALCYYYRGQARGILSRNIVLGYPKRVRAMLADWQKALELDPSFDYGGPYRMFAEVFTALPKHFGPNDLRQDLNKALQSIEKAIKISDYPGNHLLKAEILTKSNQKEEALKASNLAKTILPKWKSHPYYPIWQKTVKEVVEK